MRSLPPNRGAQRPAHRISSSPNRLRLSELVWLALLAGSLLLLIGAVSGLLTGKIFHQYSTIKWATLAAAPLLVAFLLTVRRPSLWAAGLVIITLPIEPYVATIHAQPLSVVVLTLAVATFVVTIEGGIRQQSNAATSALVRVVPWILVALVVPTVFGTSWQHVVLYVALFVDVAWICARVSSLYPDGRLVVVLLFLAMAATQSIVAIAQYVTGNAFNLYGGAGTSSYSAQTYFFKFGTSVRTTGTFVDPISLGNVLAMAVPLALLVLLRSEVRPAYRWFAALAGAAILGGLMVSLSRASWMGAAAAVICVIAFSQGDQRRKAVTLAVACTIGVVVVASSLYGPAVGTRFSSIFNPTSSTVRTSAGDKVRGVEWATAIQAFEANPAFGLGFGNFAGYLEAEVPGTDSSSHAQNTVLQYLAEGGVFGGAALVLLGGGVIADLRRSRRTDWLYPGLVGAFTSVLVTWMTDYTVRYLSVAGCLAILVGLTATGWRGTAHAAGDISTDRSEAAPSVPAELGAR